MSSRGLGTVFWEPTPPDDGGSALFRRQGNRFTAHADDFAAFDPLREDYGP
jgi:hypothetical protein